VRLRNISLKTTLRRLEKTLRSREQLAEGLHMIDFEQLKIENQTLSEKIEERNEELAKLKRKKTVTVQILTHIREKLRHVTNQNKVVREELLGVDRSIVHARSNLTVSKHDRDVVREENVELKRQRGFATSDMLIIDFEKRKSTIDELSHSIKELRERHFLLSQQIATNQMTIRAANGLQTTQLPPIGKKR
ncbi:Ccdc96, partial [Symbiodinium microadriaticum]